MWATNTITQIIRPENSKWYVITANGIVLVVMVGITAWAGDTAGGVGPLFIAGARQPSVLSTGWAWAYGIIATLGTISAGIINQNDFTRFARRQGVQVPGLVFSLLGPGMVVPIFAIITASASMEIWELEQPFWNPLSIIIQWMLDDYSPKARAAAFFCSFGFVIGQVAENILGNGYAAGTRAVYSLLSCVGSYSCSHTTWHDSHGLPPAPKTVIEQRN
jgi:NCS1 family nucleobase:cation symporter-1